MNESYNSPEGYAVAKIHLPGYIEIPTLISALQATDVIYSELAFLDSTSRELDSLRKITPPGPDWNWERSARWVTVKNLIDSASDPSFDARYAILGTEYTPKIITAQNGGSWIIDLLGKLNPIEGLKSVIEMIRDWKTDKDSKRIQNSKLAQEAWGLELANNLTQLKILKEARDLIEGTTYSSKEAEEFIMNRALQIASGAFRAIGNTQASEFIELDAYKDQLSSPEEVNTLASQMSLQSQLPAVWSNKNSIVRKVQQQGDKDKDERQRVRS